MTEPIKLCKDCKWYKKSWFEHLTGSGDQYDTCLNPVLSQNLVTGRSNGKYCDHARKYYECGKEGKYWEAK
jgi:hypothetical protein